MDRWEERVHYYKLNKRAICGVGLGQCDVLMLSKLAITTGWEANKSDLLWVLKAAQAACIGVQENYSHHVVGCEALESLTTCKQDSNSNLDFKEEFLACMKKLDKAEISFKFGKTFINAEKKRDSTFDDATVHEAARQCFLWTMCC